MPVRLTACGLLEVSSEGTIVDVNDVLIQWLGSPKEELIERPLESVLTIRPAAELGSNTVPASATLHARSGAEVPVVAASIPGHRGDGSHSVVVLDLSPDSAQGEAVRGAGRKTQRGLLRLQILLGASVGFAEVRSEAQAAELLVDVARRAFSATHASVHLVRQEHLETVAGVNPLEPHWPAGVAPTGQYTVGADEVILVRTPADTLKYIQNPPMAPVYEAAGIHAALAAPMRYKEERLGSLICYFDHPREFDEEAVPLAEALCNQAAQAIARIRLEEHQRREAMHDVVTGLPSRRLIEEEVERTLLSGESGLCVAFIDLDGFKGVNDRLGHSAGDALLAEVGRRLQSVVRERDLIGRFGGDEFIAVAAIDHEEDAPALAERIRAALAEPYPGFPPDLPVSASVGVSIATDTVNDRFVFERLVRAADHAMYDAKSAGGDRVELTRFAA